MEQKVAKTLEADVVIAGSGPGGATVARELSKAGKKVIVCELGKYQKSIGKSINVPQMVANKGLTFSKEGLLVVIPETVGGASMLYCGTVFKPPAWLKDKYGIDIGEEVDELYQEIPIKPLPERLVGDGQRLLMETARGMGLDWNLLDKWIRHDNCDNCAQCSAGCKPGAKFTAREYVDEAMGNGAVLLTRSGVDKVITENGNAVGVRATGPDGQIEIRAGKVVLSAGGRGTPIILQRSGLYDAGKGFFVDPVTSVAGVHPKLNTMKSIPMAAGTHLDEDGIVMTDASAPLLFHLGLLGYSAPRGIANMPKAATKFGKTLSIMVKVRDDLGGRVNADGSFSKPLTDEVKGALNKGIVMAEEILMSTGVQRKDIYSYRILGAHPGGTVRIGNLLDTNCETSIKNCYCMDTSIIPEPWGVPPTLTIFAMGKRLAKHLLAR
ncbi:MAG: GMC family oxidoreductase [Desulfatitalea sp.]|nr:GMC family oxidoreductase N-terminal domain-containing protein [Desulfatitalea sp.]NNK00201.1 GMC family oxidoreductase [Desulfatitalea sp.]